MQIGPHHVAPLVLAPMAGVSDKPFRALCRHFGAGLAVSEMTTADPRLWETRKSRHRLDLAGEMAPAGVQLAGHDPALLADAARHHVDLGAQIIDLNMGCPAKKVCNVAAGSALLRDEPLVARILEAVRAAVSVPVTLKIRLGYSRPEQNAVRIARLAEAAGIAALAVHGRTRDEFFRGGADYPAIAEVKAAVGIPVIANGDIDSPEKAARVLAVTGCDGVMIGRGAQGRPWLFRQVAHHLATGETLADPSLEDVRDIVLGHLTALHAFYGETMGVRIARKHLAWYCGKRPGGQAFRQTVNAVETGEAQCAATRDYFDALIETPTVETRAAGTLRAA